LKGVRRCFEDFYRHFYRQSVRHQLWRGFAGDSAESDLSRSIEIYRLHRAGFDPSSGGRITLRDHHLQVKEVRSHEVKHTFFVS